MTHEQRQTKYVCIICGYRTLESRFDWDICPVCFWEDDVVLENGEDPTSPANDGLSVSQAQANFLLFGACSKEHMNVVRGPLPEEARAPSWRPLESAIALVERHRAVETEEKR